MEKWKQQSETPQEGKDTEITKAKRKDFKIIESRSKKNKNGEFIKRNFFKKNLAIRDHYCSL